MNELQLQLGPYRTTFIGTEITRVSTKKEWENYGEILKRVDEAKQWAIGDWLVDGKRHYGDGLYKEAEIITGVEQRTLEDLKRISGLFEITLRHVNLSWSHHREVSSLKLIETIKDKKLSQGRMQWSEKPDHEKMQEFLKKAEAKKWSVRELRSEVETYKRNKELEFALHNSPQKYEIFYADPPWKYSDELIEGYGAVVHHYKPMTIQEICKIPVKEIVSENAVLFLWVTSPILDECFEVIRSWGFEYKAQFIWDKIKHNYGHYNSVRHELLLICTKGSFLPASTELIDSVQSIERNDEHSQKPEEFRQVIHKMYPTGRRIELFARKTQDQLKTLYPGFDWNVYGNEC